MNQTTDEPIARLTFEAAELARDFPPRLVNENKRIVHGIACPPGATHEGRLVVSRWKAMDVPSEIRAAGGPAGDPTTFEARQDVFGYEPSTADDVVEWYLNFAHHDLFMAYGGPLFAQDEMQVAEHPILGSLREALLKSTLPPSTVENGEPTPILIMGAERRCEVATDRNPAKGRPFGLYGNNFAAASPEAVRTATRRIDPPTKTNLIAMEAPYLGRGRYTFAEILFILRTAYTGFRAARLETERSRGDGALVVVHTGFWGCGAYGGNPVLMPALQLLGARLGGVDRLVFHTFDAAGSEDYARALALVEDELLAGDEAKSVGDILARVEAVGFEWGVSDGN